MHEATLAQAALPALARVYGLRLRPYSLGHELWLIREGNPLALANGGSIEPQHLLEAALICAQTDDELSGMKDDWLLPLKLKVWLWRAKKHNFFHELEAFQAYQKSGSLLFKAERKRTTNPGRTLGTPFIMRLNQFLVEHLRLTEAQAWDYPYGLAQMRFQAHYEEEGALEVENEHDASFEEYCRRMDEEDAKKGVIVCQA